MVFQLDDADCQLAQISADSEELRKLFASCPDDVPSNLKQCANNLTRTYHHRLKEHTKFNDPQTWVLDRKRQNRVSRCAGCLAKEAIKNGDLHLWVDGLLFLREPDIVVETKLRFCPKANCVRSIKGTLNNIRDMQSDMEIICSQETKESLTEDEKYNFLPPF